MYILLKNILLLMLKKNLMLRGTVAAVQPTHRTVKLRFATPSGRPRYNRGQEADNDQKRTTQSLQTAYVNKSSHRFQSPTGSEHGCSGCKDAPSHVSPAA